MLFDVKIEKEISAEFTAEKEKWLIRDWNAKKMKQKVKELGKKSIHNLMDASNQRMVILSCRRIRSANGAQSNPRPVQQWQGWNYLIECSRKGEAIMTIKVWYALKKMKRKATGSDGVAVEMISTPEDPGIQCIKQTFWTRWAIFKKFEQKR